MGISGIVKLKQTPLLKKKIGKVKL